MVATITKNNIRLHYLQHVPFETIAHVRNWAKKTGIKVGGTHLYTTHKLPDVRHFDWLVIMGGPMNIYEEKKYPWLKDEKRLIESAIAHKKIVVGICLGAQLIANVLDAKITKNKYKEIGWFPVQLTPESFKSSLLNGFPEELIAFHWHGDTFGIPQGAARLAESRGCKNQAFEYNGHVLGLQFHLESSLQSIKNLIRHCGNELKNGRFIQQPREILSGTEHHLKSMNKTMESLLNRIKKTTS